MALLDVFQIIFESDTSKLDEGLKKARKNSKETTEELSKTDKIAKKVGESFKDLLEEFGGMIVAGMTLAQVMHEVKDAANFIDPLSKTMNAFGLDTHEVAAWGEAVKISGGSAEGFTSTVKSLTMEMNSLQLTGSSSLIAPLARMGISMFDTSGKIKNVMDLLPQLADKFKAMGNVKSMRMGKMLGLDEGTIMLLQKGRKAVTEQVEQMKSLDGITKESAATAAEYHQSVDKVSFAMRGLFLELGNYILPVLEKFNDGVVNIIQFFKNNKDFSVGFFTAIGIAITTFVVPPLLTAAGAAFALVAPFLAVGLAVVGVGIAVGLLYDDIVNFSEGNDSMIGSAITKWPILGEIISSIKDDVKEIVDDIKDITNMDFGDFIKHPIDTIKKEMSNHFDVNHTWTVPNTVPVAIQAIDGANSSPLNNINSNVLHNSNSSNRNLTVNVGQVSVNTQANDVDMISQNIADSLHLQLTSALANFDDGIKI